MSKPLFVFCSDCAPCCPTLHQPTKSGTVLLNDPDDPKRGRVVLTTYEVGLLLRNEAFRTFGVDSVGRGEQERCVSRIGSRLRLMASSRGLRLDVGFGPGFLFLVDEPARLSGPVREQVLQQLALAA